MPSKVHPTKPSRWIHERGGDGLDAELGELFRALPPATPLAPAVIASVARRVARGPDTVTRRSLRYLPLAFAVLAGTAGAVAQWAHPGSWRLQQTYVAPVSARARTTSTVAPSKTAAPSLPEVEATDRSAPAVEEAPESRAPEPPAAVAGTASVRSPSPAAARPSQLALEAELLRKALAKLRGNHDAKSALTLLDDYQLRFPHGDMSLEAAIARVDALLMLGRRADALTLLAGLPLERMGRRIELQLVRGELYAERDCRRALNDFDAVLAGSGKSALAERALYGRAGCSLRLGNMPAGRSDLKAYLERYPSGRFADQVRNRLAGD